MRKLLSVGALLAASALTFWQPQAAEARTRVVIVTPRRHHEHYRYHRYHYRNYYRYYGYYR